MFTRRFGQATVIHLDQLSYRNIEVCIESRLVGAESEADLCSPFQEGAGSAKYLVRDVALAANVVFLWVELAVNALCSEIRTGCPIEQLHLAVSDFPTDLDEYFQKLIFDRIGTTRSNVSKTAAALKLVMVIETHKDNPGCVNNMTIMEDYLNFWLLSIGHLKPGFSWADRMDPRYPASDPETRVRQTKGLLEEICKDLTVLQAHGGMFAD